MTADRWRQIQSVFHAAAALPDAGRRAFVDGALAADPESAAQVLAMLQQDASEGTIVDGGLPGIAAQFVGASRESIASADFGPYRLKQPLGEGGMGVVYLAEDRETGQQVAIKILLDARLSPARRERFASEQRILAKLNHPNIAQLHRAGTLADGTPWFAMEYVEGRPIDDFCRELHYSMERRLRLFRALCEAVSSVHSLTFVHRDLKPSNILVTNDGAPKLLDFGLGKPIETSEGTANRTAFGLRLMTIAHAAPEQLRGLPPLFSTDVYALGVILYELATGRHPFDLSRCTASEAERTVVEQDPPRPSDAARHSPEAPRATRAEWRDLDALILKAAHKDVARRYPSVEALLRDLDHYLHAEPLDARTDSLAYTAAKFVRRNRRAVAAASIVFALVGGLTAFYTLRLKAARDAALAEAARTGRVERFMLNLIQGGASNPG